MIDDVVHMGGCKMRMDDASYHWKLFDIASPKIRIRISPDRGDPAPPDPIILSCLIKGLLSYHLTKD